MPKCDFNKVASAWTFSCKFAPNPQNGETQSNNSSTFDDELIRVCLPILWNWRLKVALKFLRSIKSYTRWNSRVYHKIWLLFLTSFGTSTVLVLKREHFDTWMSECTVSILFFFFFFFFFFLHYTISFQNVPFIEVMENNSQHFRQKAIFICQNLKVWWIPTEIPLRYANADLKICQYLRLHM